MWDTIQQFFSDFIVFLDWGIEVMKEFFLILIQPVIWFFNLAKGFFSVVFKTAEELGFENEVAEFSENALAFFDVIPYFNYIILGIGALLWLVFLDFFIKKLGSM